MDRESDQKLVALIVGVTGMAGLSLAEALKSPTALGGPWEVYGAARRLKPSWFPASIVDHYITFDAVNPDDTQRTLSPISDKITHIFWVAIQVRENEESNINGNSIMLANVLNIFKSNPASKLRHITIQTGTQHYMGPIHNPRSNSDHLIPHEPPFSEDAPRLPYPNFYYALEDVVASYTPLISYSIHRSSIIIGASSRSVYNALLTLAAYAAICRYEGVPFRYPGTKYTWEHFCDMSDARVLAAQHVWAAGTPHAKNQAFNCTNGDVFKWKRVWKILCEILKVEFEPWDDDEKFDFVGFTRDKGKVWDEIAEKYGLYETKLEEITGFEALKTVLHFEFQHVSSMNKSREFGFFGFVDTLKSIVFWVEKLRDMKIIPRYED